MKEQYNNIYEIPGRLLWQETKEHTARLVRAYGRMPAASLPEQIAGLRLTEIGDYCFAEAEHFPDGPFYITEFENGAEGLTSRKYPGEDGFLRALCGDYVEEIILPDTVTTLGRLAFYNCKNLKGLSIGNALAAIGSDAFMNTKQLHALTVRAGAGEASGIRRILAQIVHDMEITFCKEGQVEAKILFPEYTESYDEIAPAHIFGRNIEGEGFRARQCFAEGKLDFVAYDAIFSQACVEESERTLGQMAEDRLMYPYELSQSAKQQYESYIRSHEEALFLLGIHERHLELLQFLCTAKLISSQTITQGIMECSRQEWAEGAASLLQYKNGMEEKEKRYSFDEF